ASCLTTSGDPFALSVPLPCRFVPYQGRGTEILSLAGSSQLPNQCANPLLRFSAADLSRCYLMAVTDPQRLAPDPTQDPLPSITAASRLPALALWLAFGLFLL